MTQQDKLFPDYKGRARGLMNILEEERHRCNRLWVTTCPTPGCGRVETLALLKEMVSKKEWTPGCECGQSQTLGRDLLPLAPPIVLAILILYSTEVGLQAPICRE